MKKESVIEVKDLTFGYAPHEVVLNKVHFRVEKGDFWGIIGPNGGGKSTLLKLLLGLLKPWKGSIHIHGSEGSPPKGVAYVPQSLSVDRKFPITVMEVVLGARLKHLSCWGRFQKDDHEKATDALHTVGLSSLASSSFGELSGGQAQRVFIARALASEASILLLDEPMSSADPHAEASILETIEKLCGTLTILMVTHNVRALLSRVQGVLCVQGASVLMQPKEVCEHFALGLYHYPLIETDKDHFAKRRKEGKKP